MSLEKALRDTPEGVVIDVEVVPGAQADAFPSGYNAWRKRIQARVSAPAVEGRANDALLRLVAEFFAVARAHVRLVDGASGRQKRVLVVGLHAPAALARLQEGPP